MFELALLFRLTGRGVTGPVGRCRPLWMCRVFVNALFEFATLLICNSFAVLFGQVWCADSWMFLGVVNFGQGGGPLNQPCGSQIELGIHKKNHIVIMLDGEVTCANDIIFWMYKSEADAILPAERIDSF